jgi:hypothetical protein
MTDIKSNVENLELYSDNYPFNLRLRISNFQSEPDYKKFVKNCESMLRKSIEYRLWKNYLIDVLQNDHCMITFENIAEVTIEVHHHVPSLYTLMASLINKRLEKGEDFCTFDIVMEAVELHFKNKIGYVMLLTSMHEKFHNGHLDIPIELVRGDFRTYLKDYIPYIDEADLDIINERMSINRSNCEWTRDNYPVRTADVNINQ